VGWGKQKVPVASTSALELDKHGREYHKSTLRVNVFLGYHSNRDGKWLKTPADRSKKKGKAKGHRKQEAEKTEERRCRPFAKNRIPKATPSGVMASWVIHPPVGQGGHLFCC
jgi:hypothetical protein